MSGARKRREHIEGETIVFSVSRLTHQFLITFLSPLLRDSRSHLLSISRRLAGKPSFIHLIQAQLTERLLLPSTDFRRVGEGRDSLETCINSKEVHIMFPAGEELSLWT